MQLTNYIDQKMFCLIFLGFLAVCLVKHLTELVEYCYFSIFAMHAPNKNMNTIICAQDTDAHTSITILSFRYTIYLQCLLC